MPENGRELFLDHGRVFVETPRLMSDDELAVVFEAFIDQVRSRTPKSPAPTAPDQPRSPLPAYRKRKSR
jgi:hypothetical protein